MDGGSLHPEELQPAEHEGSAEDVAELSTGGVLPSFGTEHSISGRLSGSPSSAAYLAYLTVAENSWKWLR